VEFPLIASATLLGLAGAPHCTAMCSAPCAAAVGNGGARAQLSFHAARLLGYAGVGAVAASSVAALAGWSQFTPALRPLWVLLQAGALALGLWLVLKGRQPAWMSRLGRTPQPVAGGGWQAVSGPGRAAAAGSLWVAWPCGLLQSALLVAALGSSAATGAAAMAGFALASAPGLVLGPWAWRRLLQGADGAARERLAIRAAGVLLAGVAAWALGHGVWQQVAAFCGLA
jgi:sulfite exporter TauE/SafE